jgi:DNA-binding beta-propeller fold protein YncE
MTSLRTTLGVGATALSLLAATAPAASASDVVVSDLSSPLGFAVSANGTIYVAEAFAGKLTKIKPNGDRSEVASAPPGSGTAGVALSPRGNVFYTLTLPPEQGSPPETTLKVAYPGGGHKKLASLSDYEAKHNPDATNTYGILKDNQCFEDFSKYPKFLGPARYQGQVESNPYAVAWEGRSNLLVADAAGNDIVRVKHGRVSTVAVLPAIKQTLTKETVRKQVRMINRKLERRGKDPIARTSLDSCIGKKYASNPVPTDVEIGPNGDYFVSTLPGMPELPGYGKVFRIDHMTGALSVEARGLTSATDLAVGAGGRIYVTELYAGQVAMIAAGSSSVTSRTPVSCPTAVEISRGQVYVAHDGLCGPDPGQIITLS